MTYNINIQCSFRLIIIKVKWYLEFEMHHLNIFSWRQTSRKWGCWPDRLTKYMSRSQPCRTCLGNSPPKTLYGLKIVLLNQWEQFPREFINYIMCVWNHAAWPLYLSEGTITPLKPFWFYTATTRSHLISPTNVTHDNTCVL